MNSSITLSGNFYSANNLNDFKNEINPELYSFLIEWFNKEDVVLLKTSGSTGVAKMISVPVSYTHLTLPTTPYV